MYKNIIKEKSISNRLLHLLNNKKKAPPNTYRFELII